jgi:hypothetical protein
VCKSKTRIKRTGVTTAVVAKCDQEMKIIPHEKDSGVFNKSINLQFFFTVVSHTLMEESWKHNSHENKSGPFLRLLSR